MRSTKFLLKANLLAALSLLLITTLTGVANAQTRFYEITWTGTGGYTMQARLSHETPAPAIITAFGLGPTNGIETFDVTFRDPAGTIIQTANNVVGGVSSYSSLEVTFITSTGQLDYFINAGKDDGIVGDLYLMGDPEGLLFLLQVAATGFDIIDSGGPMSSDEIDSNSPLRFFSLNWTGSAGYETIARFAFDRRFTPPVISATGADLTEGLDYLEVSFRNPGEVLLQTVIAVEGGVSNHSLLFFSFDTFMETLGSHIDIGKNDVAGDLRLSGDPNGTSVNLFENPSTTLDTGGPVSVHRILDSFELNDEFAAATSIQCHWTGEATIDPLGDVDVYVLAATPGAKARIDIDAIDIGSALDPLIAVFDSAGTLVASSDDDAAPDELPTADSYLDVFTPSDGILYIVVTSSADFDFNGLAGDRPYYTGEYSIRVGCGFMPGLLLGVTGSYLVRIDLLGGTTGLSPLFSLGPVSEIEFDSGGQLFGTTGGGDSRVFTVDPEDYSQSVYCEHPPGTLDGLEFVNGTMYGTHTVAPNTPSSLVIVNGPPSPGGLCTFTTIGPTGFYDIGGLAYDALTETMYGCAVNSGGGPSSALVEIDLDTGVATPVGAGSFTDGACGALEFVTRTAYQYNGLAGLYAATDNLFNLFKLNPYTGTGSIIRLPNDRFESLAFVPGLPVDSDNDGVADTIDNCVATHNPDQRDTNHDGIGNACDPDLNDDCRVNFIDLNTIKQHFFLPGDLDTDFDGDGMTNFADLNVMKQYFFGIPGPSATTCGITNGSFENGLAGWTVIDHPAPVPFSLLSVILVGAGSSFFDFFTTAPTDGNLAVLVGFGGHAAASITIGQNATVIPSAPVLRADYRAGWGIIPCSTCGDRVFRFNVYDNGVLLATEVVDILPADTINWDTGDRLLEVDLSAFSGMRVYFEFEFEVPDAFNEPAILQLDNVRLGP